MSSFHFSNLRRHSIARATKRWLRVLSTIGFGLSLLGIFLPDRILVQARKPHSVPLTLGIRLAAPSQWQPGDLVTFRTRNLRPYYPAGAPFAKIVAGVGGQPIARLGRDFYVAGRYIGTAQERDSAGRVAPLYTPPPTSEPLCRHPAAWIRPVMICGQTFATVIPEGHLFTIGQHDHSFDSRYWGLVAPEEITGRVVPIF